MQLSDFLDLIEQLTGSPVRIVRRKDIPYLLDTLKIDNLSDNEKKILKDSYLLDEKIRKFRLKSGLPIEKKKSILGLFARINQDNPTLDEKLLEEIISKNNKLFDRNQFNELLLLCNKDRMEDGFFDFFFRKQKMQPEAMRLQDIAKNVDRFRKYAMLVYGNFKFAYRKLSKMKYSEIESEIAEYIQKPEEIESSLSKRSEKIQDIEKIDFNKTYLLGYLSGANIEFDLKISKQFKESVNTFSEGAWEDFKKHIRECSNNDMKNDKDLKEELKNKIRKRISKILKNFENCDSKDIDNFKVFVYESAVKIEELDKERSKLLAIGRKNNQLYLTWDYMDLYLATSMREKWEFEDFCKLVEEIFEKNDDIKNLNLRYFNPVQSYEESTVDKGLVEGLMLKRAKCTIYSIQESDTVGKDSELATTLVQGKPVIAFVKTIDDVSLRAEELKDKPLEFFKDRFMLLEKEGLFEENNVVDEIQDWIRKKNIKTEEPIKFISDFTKKIIELIDKKVWSSIRTPWVNEEKFKEGHNKRFGNYCYFIAITEKHFYIKRANILSERHPLRLQIDLKTGVANGILVARGYEQCATLLKNIITNKIHFDLNFDLKYNKKENCWVLEERISKCIYRAVTDNMKVTNSFWNFYLEKEKEGQDAKKK